MTADRKVIAAILDARRAKDGFLADALTDEELASLADAIGDALDETPPIIDRLEVDGRPTVQFGPDVAALMLLTTTGAIQVVGREGIPNLYLADALGSAALNLGGVL